MMGQVFRHQNIFKRIANCSHNVRIMDRLILVQ